MNFRSISAISAIICVSLANTLSLQNITGITSPSNNATGIASPNTTVSSSASTMSINAGFLLAMAAGAGAVALLF
ncbi:hypothetical protein DASC09_014080 [Saccharomycopsis crataegensis]|uniref:Uncharacterized protein n=1 Tax=Saccharomycopsis crataegensis TaxID=43959 RepID=A0AAV5QGV6_9ASCO|nr:hypothetical protein DASC09_014080 [Saccharomycopsis crataegensis]